MGDNDKVVLRDNHEEFEDVTISSNQYGGALLIEDSSDLIVLSAAQVEQLLAYLQRKASPAPKKGKAA